MSPVGLQCYGTRIVARWNSVSFGMEDNRAVLPLDLGAHDAEFIVFRRPAKELRREVTEIVRWKLGTVIGPWEIHFQPERGALEHATCAVVLVCK